METLESIKFLTFCIKAKTAYTNSILIGSKHIIAKKIGVSDYICRTYLNFGIKHGLIKRLSKNKYQIAKYSKLIRDINMVDPTECRFIRLHKDGSFNDITSKNLFAFFGFHLKAQEWMIKRKNHYNRLFEKTVSTGKSESMRRGEVKAFCRLRKEFGAKRKIRVNNYLMSGLNHLSHKLGVSVGKAHTLFKEWQGMGLIKRNIIIKDFNESLFKDPYFSRPKNLVYINDGYKLILGSKITLLSGLEPCVSDK